MAKNFFDVNDKTLEPSEVHRKDSDELYETAFNDDQKKVLDNFEPGGDGSVEVSKIKLGTARGGLSQISFESVGNNLYSFAGGFGTDVPITELIKGKEIIDFVFIANANDDRVFPMIGAVFDAGGRGNYIISDISGSRGGTVYGIIGTGPRLISSASVDVYAICI